MEDCTQSKRCGYGQCPKEAEWNSARNKFYFCCPEHRLMRQAYGRAYFKQHKERQNRITLENYHNLRKQVMEMYGNQCQCCGVDEEAFLALDHVNGGGQEHRKRRGHHGVYRDALDANDSTQFRILCHNCNFATYKCGVCPHVLVKGVK